LTDGATDESKASKPNGRGDDWVLAASASKASGMHVRTLGKLAERGELERRREEDNEGRVVWKYNLREVLLRAQGPDRTPPDPAVQLAKVQSDMTQTAMLHAERSWSLVHGPLLDVITELRLAVKDANADNKALRAELLAGEKQRREIENAAHERRMAEQILISEQQRKDELLASVKGAAKVAWPEVRDALESFSKLAKLKRTFDPSKIRALLDVPGMLSPEEAAALREIFGDVLWSSTRPTDEPETSPSDNVVDAEGTTPEGEP